MSIRLPKTTRQAGDTIVEVMLVLAILGLAISISYATANRSLLNARQAQENSQATELVRSQLEALRTLSKTGSSPNIFAVWPVNSCLSQTSPYTIQSGAACALGSVPYQLTITYTSSPTDTFTIQAAWPDVLGLGNDTVTTVYRLHPTP